MLDRFEQFTSAISALYRDVQKIERDEMEKQGLRGAFAQYLLAISRHPEGITAATLCEVCDKDKAAVSRIIAEMESKGLVEKENDGTSQYRARLRLTPAGQEAAACDGVGQVVTDRNIIYPGFRFSLEWLKLESEGGHSIWQPG